MSHDTWIHRVARVCIRPLINSPVTPNHLTVARGVCGVSAAALLALAAPWSILFGCLLFAVSMLLDRADGELARARAQTSVSGHFLDLYSDAVCDVCVLLALGVALRHGAFGIWAPLMGLAAALSAAFIFQCVIRVDRSRGAGTVRFPCVAGIDPDDLIIIIPVSLLCGVGDWVLMAAAVATPLAMMLVCGHLRKIQRISPTG